MDKEEFTKVFDLINILNKETDKWNDFGINIFESKLINTVWEIQDLLFRSNFTNEGCDWINWWLFEKDLDSSLEAFDEDGNEIPVETIDDLWNLVKEYRK